MSCVLKGGVYPVSTAKCFAAVTTELMASVVNLTVKYVCFKDSATNTQNPTLNLKSKNQLQIVQRPT